MKTVSCLLASVFGLLTFGCMNNGNEPNPENHPPQNFTLVSAANNATGVALFPELTWEAAVDPDGDVVTYDLFLDTNSDPSTLLQGGIAGTSFTLTGRLPLLTTYYWKVVAYDAGGAQTESAVFSFTTRSLNKAKKAVEEASFSKRNYHSSVVYDNKLWVIGGLGALTNSNDVWQSSDGVTWTEQTDEAEFAARDLQTSVVFNNKMWVIAGHTMPLEDDVWSSSNGTTWTMALEGGEFPQVAGHTSVVFDNKMWVISGQGKTEAWSSTNGIDWTQATATTAFSGRTLHASVVFDDKMWVLGGFVGGPFLNDVWYSQDGATWTQATGSADFPKRAYHQVVALDGKMWLIGGLDNETYFNDVWYSEDGVTWTEALADAGFSKRRSHTCVVHDNKIWVIAGFDESLNLKNDVWYLE